MPAVGRIQEDEPVGAAHAPLGAVHAAHHLENVGFDDEGAVREAELPDIVREAAHGVLGRFHEPGARGAAAQGLEGEASRSGKEIKHIQSFKGSKTRAEHGEERFAHLAHGRAVSLSLDGFESARTQCSGYDTHELDLRNEAGEVVFHLHEGFLDALLLHPRTFVDVGNLLLEEIPLAEHLV